MVRFFGIFLSLPFKPPVIGLSSGMVQFALSSVSRAFLLFSIILVAGGILGRILGLKWIFRQVVFPGESAEIQNA
jgi:hypothetical protein